MKHLSRHKGIRICLAFSLLSLTACHVRQDFHEPTIVTSQKISLHQDIANFQERTDKVDDTFVQRIAEDYHENGKNSLEITVTYDPNSFANNVTAATSQSQRIAKLFSIYGVSNISTDVLPASARGDESQTLVSYPTLKAEIPTGCGQMGGVGGQPTTINPDYQLGCTIETQMAGQIASPKDLAGRGGLDIGSGRRAANVEDTYEHGVSNPPLQNTESSTKTSSQ